jgi:nitrogen regulatory protein P-II 1
VINKNIMKKIEAIIRPEKFEIVKDALTEIGYGGMSVSEIKGHGNQKGVSEVWRGKRYRVEMLPKTRIDLVVSDDAVEQVVQIIIDVSQTGSIGDGKIFVSEISNAYRIRTGEQGDVAI